MTILRRDRDIWIGHHRRYWVHIRRHRHHRILIKWHLRIPLKRNTKIWLRVFWQISLFWLNINGGFLFILFRCIFFLDLRLFFFRFFAGLRNLLPLLFFRMIFLRFICFLFFFYYFFFNLLWLLGYLILLWLFSFYWCFLNNLLSSNLRRYFNFDFVILLISILLGGIFAN